MMLKSIFLLVCFLFGVLMMGLNAHVVADELRDPSAPLFNTSKSVKKIVKPKPVKRYVLSYVFVGEDKRLAIINSKAYQEGDSIGGYKIIKINLNEVLMSSSNVTKALNMYPVDKAGFSIK